MLRALFALLFLAAVTGPSAAPVRAQSDENGGLVGLVLPLGARAVGQGRAVAGERAELQALPYNPAAVVGLEEGALTYSRFQGADLEDDLDGFNGNYLAGAYVGTWGTLAGHFVYQDLGEVLLTDSSPDPIGSIDLSEWVVGLTYANEVRHKVAYGVTAKWYRSDLGVTEASGPAFEVSGRGLDRIPRAQQLAIHWSSPPPGAPVVGAVFALCDEISRLWTRRQAEVLVETLSPGEERQQALASHHGVSQQAIAKRLSGGGDWALQRAMAALEGTAQ